eukprot:jgi/Botrbrau1/2811/Bobra.0125s0022.1
MNEETHEEEIQERRVGLKVENKCSASRPHSFWGRGMAEEGKENHLMGHHHQPPWLPLARRETKVRMMVVNYESASTQGQKKEDSCRAVKKMDLSYWSLRNFTMFQGMVCGMVWWDPPPREVAGSLAGDQSLHQKSLPTPPYIEAALDLGGGGRCPKIPSAPPIGGNYSASLLRPPASIILIGRCVRGAPSFVSSSGSEELS